MGIATLSDAQRQAYQEQGYLIFRQAFTPARVRALRDAVERMVERGRAGELELRWIDRERGVVDRVAHLMHPDKYDPAFGAWVAEDLADPIEDLIEGPARHSLFGMLASGGGRSYSLPWHRDLGNPDAPHDPAYYEQEPLRFTQFNAPIRQRDPFLQIIPASHRRPATPAEVEQFHRDPQGEMPGQITVELEPGDAVFYNANLWHRGHNPAGELRWSLHAAYWRAAVPVMTHEAGQAKPLSTPGHLERMPPRAADLIRRYLAAYPEGEPRHVLDVVRAGGAV